MLGWWTSTGVAFSVIFPFMLNLHHFYDLIQFKVCINVYTSIKVYINVICSIFVNLNLIKQKHTLGPFSNICLGQRRITEPRNQIAKVMIFTPTSHLHQPAPLATEGVKMKLHQGGDQLPLSSCLPSAKQCVAKGLQLCKKSQELRVQACQSSTNALWDVRPLLGGAWSAAGKWHLDTASLTLPCVAV